MYREIFSNHYPSPSAKKTVPPQGKSVACSTEAAIKWDAAFENLVDPSGRAVAGVHDQVFFSVLYTTIYSTVPSHVEVSLSLMQVTKNLQFSM